ncbi:MAG: glycosyltransferase family 4 protein [Verrucomicrobiota bacterium]
MIDLINGLSDLGVESLVLYPDAGPIEGRLKVEKIRGKQIFFSSGVCWPSEKPLYHPRRWFSSSANALRTVKKKRINKLALRETQSVLREFKPDCIVSNTAAVSYGSLIAARHHIPHVWHIREYGDLDWDFSPDFGMKRRSKELNQSRRAICISKAVAKHHIKQNPSVPISKFITIYNGIGCKSEVLERFNPKPTRGDSLNIGIAGLIKPSKGQAVAVKAFAASKQSLPNLRMKLLVAGKGDTSELEALAKNLGVKDQVDFLGHLEYMDNFYKSLDIGLMCSENEGFGRVTAEYMSWGIPVIGRNSGATPEIVENNLTGLLYDNAEEFTEKMISLLESLEERQRLGKNGRKKAIEYYSSERSAEAFLTAVKEAI